MHPVLQTILDILLALGGLGGLGAILAVIWERRGKVAQATKLEAESRKTDVETRKTEAEVAGVFIDSSGDLVENYRKMATELSCQVSELRAIQLDHSKQLTVLNQTVEWYAQRIAYLMGGIDQLIRQIIQLKGTPVWRPTPWVADDSTRGKEDR